jgi:5-methyltetrahydropteroyltriglutamate--homocysteine methyltransferase
MKRSTDRILTTHTGSLPRTPKVIELLLAERQNRGARKAELNAAVSDAIAHVVQKQIESGIDVINDGEQGEVWPEVGDGLRGRRRRIVGVFEPPRLQPRSDTPCPMLT